MLSSDKCSKEMFIFQSHKEVWRTKKKKKRGWINYRQSLRDGGISFSKDSGIPV